MVEELPEISVENPAPPLPPPRPADLTVAPEAPQGQQGQAPALKVGEQQYIRALTLQVGDGAGSGLQLAGADGGLRVRFMVKMANTATPPAADIYVYNLAKATAKKIADGSQAEFKKVGLSAGYNGSQGRIFGGGIIQARRGRENPVETYLNLVATENDKGYNFGVINTTLKAGHTWRDQVEAAFKAMQKQNPDLQLGFIDDLGSVKMPRSRSFFGMARDVLNDVATATRSNWSVSNGKLQIIKSDGYLKSEAVVLNSGTGMVGLPVQTLNGIEVRCLLNHKIGPGTRIKIDESSIQRGQFSPEYLAEANNNLYPKINDSDGTYKVLVVIHHGDTHENDWYSDLICISTGDTIIPQGLAGSGINIPD
jgi:hypothetical protein